MGPDPREPDGYLPDAAVFGDRGRRRRADAAATIKAMMELPSYVAFGANDAGKLGINPFALTLIAESFADDPAKYEGSALVSAHAHNGTEVFILISKTRPEAADFAPQSKP